MSKPNQSPRKSLLRNKTCAIKSRVKTRCLTAQPCAGWYKPKFDLEKPNPDYFQRIRERLTKAREAGIYVSVMLFEGFGVQFGEEAWANHPMNPANNINGVDGDKNGDDKGIEIHQLAKKRVTKVQNAYLRWLVTGLNEFDNLLYERRWYRFPSALLLHPQEPFSVQPATLHVDPQTAMQARVSIP